MSKFTLISQELTNNAGLYGAMTDQQVADELNAVDKTQNRTSMSRQEIYSQIEASALAGLTAVELSHLSLALADSVDPFDANVVKVFTNIFGSGSATLLALAGARVETVTRLSQIGVPAVETASLVGWVTNARGI